MNILKPPTEPVKTRRVLRYYGKCSKCKCEFSASEKETYFVYSYPYPRISVCPVKECNGQVNMYSKRKYIK